MFFDQTRELAIGGSAAHRPERTPNHKEPAQQYETGNDEKWDSLPRNEGRRAPAGEHYRCGRSRRERGGLEPRAPRPSTPHFAQDRPELSRWLAHVVALSAVCRLMHILRLIPARPLSKDSIDSMPKLPSGQ
jgi:hypothetical protein